MKKKYRCFSLFSGGLDSMLSVVFMRKLGYEVLPIFFRTPFFTQEKALVSAKEIGVDLIVHDITEKHLGMMKNPRYGFGKYLNPCIDCHGLMFKTAGELMSKYDVDFLFSGEVLGQRPMSQRKDALNSVGKLSHVKDLLIRPLSQKLLVDTLPIREGWVNKDEMLDIQGRSRQRQMEMAKEFGINHFPTPGGGCLLTDRGFSNRLQDLFDHDMSELDFIKYLKTGRHFRINKDVKLIVGRNKGDNDALTELGQDEIFFKLKEKQGPLGVINSTRKLTNNEIEIAAAIVFRYENKLEGKREIFFGRKFRLENSIKVEKMPDNEVKKYLI